MKLRTLLLPILLAGFSGRYGAPFGAITGQFTSTTISAPTTNGCADTALTVTNATVGQPCVVSPASAPSSAGGVSWHCYASASGTIQLHLCCVTATCTVNSITWTVEQ